MPTYQFRDKNTGKEWSAAMTMSEREEFLTAHPHIEQFIGIAPSLGDPVRLGVTKVDGGFRDVLKKIHKNNRGSKIDSGNISQV